MRRLAPPAVSLEQHSCVSAPCSGITGSVCLWRSSPKRMFRHFTGNNLKVGLDEDHRPISHHEACASTGRFIRRMSCVICKLEEFNLLRCRRGRAHTAGGGIMDHGYKHSVVHLQTNTVCYSLFLNHITRSASGCSKEPITCYYLCKARCRILTHTRALTAKTPGAVDPLNQEPLMNS